jgi:hypothetical protein
MCNESLNVHPAAVVPNFTAVGFGVQAVEPLKSKPLLVDLANHETAMISGCLSAEYNPATNQICLNLPIVGSKCVTSPVTIPIGGQLQACYQTCGIFPTGVRVTIRLNGSEIYSTSFGRC